MFHWEVVKPLLCILLIPGALALFRASRNWQTKNREELDREIRDLTK